jgi:thioesterase domain-containing protein
MAPLPRLAAVVSIALWLGGCGYGEVVNSWFNQSAPPDSATGPKLEGHVYLLRGLVGDIYSLGLDQLADRITRRGVAATVRGVSQYSTVADEIIRKHRAGEDRGPIMLIGHSTGGDLIIAIAARLKAAGIPVALAFGFDPTRISDDVPSNVELFINIYQRFNPIGGGEVTPARGFQGRLINVDLREHREIVHINLDKSQVIHDLVASKIVAVAAAASARAADPGRKKPAASAPGEVRPLVLKYIVPADQPIELWDSAIKVTVRSGETLETLVATYGAPAWLIQQVNHVNADRPIEPGRVLLIPRSLENKTPPLPPIPAKPRVASPAVVGQSSPSAIRPVGPEPARASAGRAPRNAGSFSERWAF